MRVVVEPTVRRSTRWAAAAALGMSLLAGVPAQAAPAADPAGDPAGDTYVALGDSYTAGPLIPLQTGLPPGCLRSNRNFPSLVAQTLGTANLRDVSCSAATTDDLAAPQTTSAGVNPPQYDALDEGVDLVTLGMGGNDIGFGEIIAECSRRSPQEPSGAACMDFYTAGGGDELAARIHETAPKIATALAGISTRSPHARVLVVGYPAILPDTGPGCFPVVPFSAGDVAYLRDTEMRLNAMLAEQAGAGGAEYVDTYTPTIGHDVCRPPGDKWIEGLVPTAPAAPVHPNALGMVALAQAVLDVVTA